MDNKYIIPTITGTAFFAIPYLALSLPVIPSILMGGAAFVAGELILKKDDIKQKNKQKNTKKVLDNAKSQNNHIKEMEKNIEDESIKKNLSEINKSISNIIDTIEKNPNKIKGTDNFFEYYLPLTVKVIDRYNDIEDRKLSSNYSDKFVKSTKEMIKDANYAFKSILNKLYESDIIDEYAEMNVFNSMLKMDGFDSNQIDVKENSNG